MGNLFLAVSGLKCASRVLPSPSLEQKRWGFMYGGCVHACGVHTRVMRGLV